jgi:Uma2 family endonuclease
MIASPQNPNFSPSEYLQIEERSPIKHEYMDGHIYAMVGASGAQNIIAGNLITLLRNHLRGSGCRVYFSDMKVSIESRNRFFYPDLLVTCDSQDSDQEAPYYKRFPSLIVEILSSSTEAFDRGDKFEDYQALDSLREYVLISSKRQTVQCFRRNSAGLWVMQSYAQAQETFQFTSVNFSGTLEQLYEDVTF